MRRLILASASPRRRELLEELGLAPEVRPSDVDETPCDDEDGPAMCLRLARAKAGAVVVREDDGPSLVIAADTVVCVDRDILGKPADRADNASMMAAMQGRWHQVHTGVCLRLVPEGRELFEVATTGVHFAAMSAAEIAWYVASDEGLDKAGGYAVQGRAGVFVRGLDGSYANVVGLPTELVFRLSKQLSCPLLDLSDPP